MQLTGPVQIRISDQGSAVQCRILYPGKPTPAERTKAEAPLYYSPLQQVSRDIQPLDMEDPSSHHI